CMALDVQTIAQAQVAKFVVAQAAGQEAARLVAKLSDALVHQGFVNYIIPIHANTIRPLPLEPPITGKHELMTSGPVRPPARCSACTLDPTSVICSAAASDAWEQHP